MQETVVLVLIGIVLVISIILTIIFFVGEKKPEIYEKIGKGFKGEKKDKDKRNKDDQNRDK
ncbi:MAG: hypothetical protein GX241_00645 [Ruminococcaceae bacterium]|nr:hypothetical protein [Oscillospiraceae bacterium]